MSNRISFMGTLGGFGMLTSSAFSAAGSPKRRIFVLEHYYLKNGNQAGRLHEYFKAAISSLRSIYSGPKIVLQAFLAAHIPQVAVILGFESLDEYWSVRARMRADSALAKALEAWENNPVPPYEHFSSAILEAADFCPEVKEDAERRQSGRTFELRTYHSPNARQLKALHDRFAGGEVDIFHRSGMNPILYASTIIGQNMPNLVWLIPYEDLAAREKGWNAFGKDPEWPKVRAEFEKYGEISVQDELSLWWPTGYSPIR